MSHLAQSGTQNPLIPSMTELVLGIAVFFLVFGVLAKLLLPRIQKTLEDRTDAIEGGLQRAEEAQAEAARMLEQYRAQLADARKGAARLREEAREQGAQIIAEVREHAGAEGRRLVEAAHAQIEADRQQALRALMAEVGAIAVDLASRVVGESLADEARQSRVIDRLLAEFEQEPEVAER